MQLVKRLLMRQWPIALGILVHLFLLWAVFDTYFKSPLVHGMSPHGAVHSAQSRLASRLVLFVADGLRAHSLLENTSRAPYLRTIMSGVGTWGVSHTRVPTESRPGHVAIIAGFYEDVSAIATGWQENPVQFDSVFNESRYTWSWGSPDILPMFAKGASGSHVFTHCYDSAVEDFASEDASKLDTWVFNEVQRFFQDGAVNATLSKMLRNDQLVYFLHLLGLDTNGHGNKPRSNKYLENINIVDKGIADTVRIIENFYNNDGRTAYIFTSDHGMTDWGSHGSGDDHETMTPMVAWGAGIAATPAIDDIKEDVQKSPKQRKDLDQVDIAPLMSALLGLNMPMNSIGILPRKYLNASDSYMSLASCANFEQVVEQMLVQRRRKERTSFGWTFAEYQQLSAQKLASIRTEINRLLQQRRFAIVSDLCHKWTSVAVNGLLYYHNYDRRLLSICVATSFFLWMICSWRLASTTFTGTSNMGISSGKPYILTAVAATILLKLHSWTLMKCCYVLLPILLAYVAEPVFQNYCRKMNRPNISINGFVTAIALAVFIEVLVSTFFYRWILTGVLWVLAFWPIRKTSVTSNLKIAWMLNCLTISIFPLLATVGQVTNTWLVFMICETAWLAFSAFIIWLRRKQTSKISHSLQIDLRVCAFLSGAVFLAGWLNYYTSSFLMNKQGLSLILHGFSWTLLIVCPVSVLALSQSVVARLGGLATAMFCPFVLMSVNYEPLFYILLCSLLYFWLRIEQQLANCTSAIENLSTVGSLPVSQKQNELFNDLRRASFFVFFIVFSFFATGNIASINSFNPMFVAPFITVFSPFIMGALLLIKIATPFLLVSAALYGLEIVICCNIGSIFWLIVVISDGMALRFFFLLRDYGSWLDIGTSISHYIIAMVTILIIMLLYSVAKLFMTKTMHIASKRHFI